MTYLQHVEVKPREWRRIFQELAPQALRSGAYEGNFLACVGIDLAAAMAPQAKGKKAKRR